MTTMSEDRLLQWLAEHARPTHGFADGDKIQAPEHGWTDADRQQWQRLCEYKSPEAGGREEEFVGRVAVALRCDLPFATAAIVEYYRFCFLATHAAVAPLPGPLLDDVWRTHIVDTKDYRAYCAKVLQRDLHRPSAPGNDDELDRQRRQYAELWTRYPHYFGDRPKRFWPTPEAEKPAPAIVARPPMNDVDLLTPLLLFGAATTLTYVVIAFVLGLGQPLRWPDWAFLIWYIFLACAAAVLSFIASSRCLQPSRLDTGLLRLAHLSGGPSRVADTIVVELLAHGLVELDYDRANAFAAFAEDRVWLRRRDHHGDHTARSEDMCQALKLIDSGQSLNQVLKGLSETQAPKHAPMRFQRSRLWWAWWSSTPAMMFVAVLGLIKLGNAFHHSSPGFVIACLFVVLPFALLTIAVCWPSPEDMLSTIGKHYRYHASRRAPDDLPTQVALHGPDGLIGTELAEYHRVRRRPPAPDLVAARAIDGPGEG